LREPPARRREMLAEVSQRLDAADVKFSEGVLGEERTLYVAGVARPAINSAVAGQPEVPGFNSSRIGAAKTSSTTEEGLILECNLHACSVTCPGDRGGWPIFRDHW
jgi:hypothetical protein